MHERSSPEVVRHLRTLYQFGVTGGFRDEQLLERFVSRRDEVGEEAFAELVQRHGPMVLGVCRRVLGDAHDAEDAFQATFLVLARKAATVVRREKVASWLYGVAVRTAKEARVRAARRRAREERVSKRADVDPPGDESSSLDELRAVLDEELARLPARHRGPIVLCELEGLPRPEAARRLGIPEGTLSSRLARARARLRDRLAMRGVTLSVAALSAALIREARAAAVPFSLFESTVEAAALVAAGPITAASVPAISAAAASLSEGVIHTMLVAKIKGIVLAVGTMSAFVSGAVVLAQGQAGPGTGKRQAVPPPVATSVETKVERKFDAEERTAALEKKLDRVLAALERMTAGDLRAPSVNLPPPVAPQAEDIPHNNPLRPDAVPTAFVPTETTVAESAPGPPQQGRRVSQPAPLPAPEAPMPPQANPASAPVFDERPSPPATPNGPTGIIQAPPSSDVRPPLSGGPVPAPMMQPQFSPPPRAASLVQRIESLDNQMGQALQRLERMENRIRQLEQSVGIEVEENRVDLIGRPRR